MHNDQQQKEVEKHVEKVINETGHPTTNTFHVHSPSGTTPDTTVWAKGKPKAVIETVHDHGTGEKVTIVHRGGSYGRITIKPSDSPAEREAKIQKVLGIKPAVSA